MSRTRTAVEDADANRSECWCCGAITAPTRVVHLGNHPEVALCIRCAHSVSKWAWEIEDQSKTGPLVMARDRFRMLRRDVIRRGWQHNAVFGGPIRWIGKRLP
jgi:hypothetical protein